MTERENLNLLTLNDLASPEKIDKIIAGSSAPPEMKEKFVKEANKARAKLQELEQNSPQLMELMREIDKLDVEEALSILHQVKELKLKEAEAES